MTAEVIPLGQRPVRALRSGRSPRLRCGAITTRGRPCRNGALENGFCPVHQPPVPPESIGPFEAERIRAGIEFIVRRVTGAYDVDPFGFDRELTEKVFLPLMRPLHRYYWRVRWLGLENVPSRGPALLACNHGGTLPVDSLVVKFGLLDQHPAHRHLRLLAADLAFRIPVVAPLTRKMGNTLACDEDAYRLLGAGELVGVFPEGYKGVGKGWKNRYRLQRFGRGGFTEVAMRARVPVVPVAIVGAEETYPMIANVRPLARVAGLPYFPITPLFPWLGPLGAIPLPSKWIVEFGPPIATDGLAEGAWQDAMARFELADRVRDTIQQMIYRNLMLRGSTFV